MGRMSIAAQRPKSPRAARQFLPAALIVGAALLAYAPIFRAGFVWDDNNFLVMNRLIHAPDGLYRFWFTRAPADYFPLTSSMLWFEWRLWGANAAGYHAVNLLLHAASAVLLWRVLLRLEVPGAWLAGMLFALHPVTVASAGWISEGKNTLSMVLCLGSLLAWTRSQNAEGRTQNEGTQNAERRTQNAEQEADRARRLLHSALCALRSAFCTPCYLLSLWLFLLALLAKTSVVMLPAVLLLLAWWKRGKPSARDWLRAAPFFALSLALGLVTVWFQQHNAIGQEVVRAEGAASRIAACGWIAWFYLYKMLLPGALCGVYPRWAVDGSSLLAFLPLALLGAATLLLWAGRKRWGAGPVVAWACFLAALLPVLGFVNMSFMSLSLVADHLQYAAMPAILAFVAAVFSQATAGVRSWPAKAFAAFCLAALATLTFQRAGIFTSNLRLWSDNVEKSPRSARVWWAMGMSYFYDHTLEKGVRYGEALRALDRAIELEPDLPDPWAGRGEVCAQAGRAEEALRAMDRYVALLPKSAFAYLKRGSAYMTLKRFPEAISDYDRAIELRPDVAETWYNRSNAWFEMRRFDEALRDLDRAIGLRPDFAEAYVNRGLIHALAGRSAEAVRDYDEAIAADPDCAKAYVNLGLIRAAEGRSAEAMSDYNKAIAREPDCVEAWYNRGTAYAQTGRLVEALSDLDEAIALKPDYVEAYVNRGNVYLTARHYPEAIGDYSQAIACDPRYAEAWYDRANAELAADRPAEAIRDLDRLIELRPQEAGAYSQRALAHRRLKQDREALADLERARQLGATVPEDLLRSLQPAK
jgi:tetratricopeptide (TPR) repeat protein